MIEKLKQRQLKQLTHKNIIDGVTSIVENDEEFFFCLLWAQNIISNCLLDFKDDIKM